MSEERRKIDCLNEEKGFDGVIEKKGVRQLCMTQLFLSNHVNPPPNPSRSRSAFKAERPKRQITGSKQAITIEGDPRFAVEQRFAFGHLEPTAFYMCA